MATMVPGFDAHTHLDLPAWPELGPVLDRARFCGVRGAFVAGADPADWGRVERVATTWRLPYSLGVHPWWCQGIDLDAALARLSDVAWIGETGLDRLHARSPQAWDQQVKVFRAHLSLARARRVPVVLHLVRAYPEALGILRRDGSPGGVVHAWSGPSTLVPDFVGLGFALSFGPLICGDRAQRARDAARACPDTALLAETDAPDYPKGLGRPTEPADLRAVTAALADLRGKSEEAILTLTGQNARAIYGC
jgi:TatD DNase family protein